jgi:predicted kinase/spermidine synthase
MSVRTVEIPVPALVLLVGVAGCGKTTFADAHFTDDEVLSSDRLRAVVAGDPQDQSASGDAFAALRFLLDKRLKRGLLSVVDATNLERRHRLQYRAIADAHDVPTVVIVLDVELAICLERDARRSDRTVGEEVLRVQRRDLERSLRQLPEEGYGRVVVLGSAREVERAEIVRAPTPAGARDQRGGETNPRVIERVRTPRGELVLRRAGDEYEIISNGVFLMDTRETTSAQVLVEAALGACDRPSRVLIGGLGVGVSLAAALAHPTVTRVDVVEVEEAVIRWNRTYLAGVHGHALDDPRSRIVHADLVEWLTAPEGAPAGSRYDAICLDIDNGPGWTVTEDNARLYLPPTFERVADLLGEGGVVSVWSAARDDRFEEVLADHVADVEVIEVPVPRGVPDVVYLGTRR